MWPFRAFFTNCFYACKNALKGQHHLYNSTAVLVGTAVSADTGCVVELCQNTNNRKRVLMHGAAEWLDLAKISFGIIHGIILLLVYLTVHSCKSR